MRPWWSCAGGATLTAPMLTDVFLGIIGSFGSEKTGCLVHVGMETCHVTPPAGEGEYEGIAHE